jgi:transcriptional regulator with XRE-family HTH domain
MIGPFSDRLMDLRVAAGLTEQEMCAWLGGVAKSTLGSWLRGKREPTWYSIGRLNKSLDYLEKELRRTHPRLPLPIGVRKQDRLGAIRGVRDDYPSR